jgi:DNA-directed RNA polymerase specialized sigma24 family protein
MRIADIELVATCPPWAPSAGRDDGLGFERVEAMLDAARRVTLSELKDELSAGQAEAITGRVVEERSYEELGAKLTCSPQVVRPHVSRGLRIPRRNRKVPA